MSKPKQTKKAPKNNFVALKDAIAEQLLPYRVYAEQHLKTVRKHWRTVVLAILFIVIVVSSFRLEMWAQRKHDQCIENATKTQIIEEIKGEKQTINQC